MSEGRIRAMAMNAGGVMRVDWVALTLGIIGSGLAIIALIVMLERGGASSHDCVEHADQAQTTAVADACEE